MEVASILFDAVVRRQVHAAAEPPDGVAQRRCMVASQPVGLSLAPRPLSQGSDWRFARQEEAHVHVHRRRQGTARVEDEQERPSPRSRGRRVPTSALPPTAAGGRRRRARNRPRHVRADCRPRYARPAAATERRTRRLLPGVGAKGLPSSCSKRATMRCCRSSRYSRTACASMNSGMWTRTSSLWPMMAQARYDARDPPRP